MRCDFARWVTCLCIFACVHLQRDCNPMFCCACAACFIVLVLTAGNQLSNCCCVWGGQKWLCAWWWCACCRAMKHDHLQRDCTSCSVVHMCSAFSLYSTPLLINVLLYLRRTKRNAVMSFAWWFVCFSVMNATICNVTAGVHAQRVLSAWPGLPAPSAWVCRLAWPLQVCRCICWRLLLLFVVWHSTAELW